MSDYLWDKTGEPEEDVAQLENLLGALKYQPRPLEIPAAAMPPSARAAAAATTARPRPTTIFSRPRLALAASLLLTLLAGAWLFTRQGEEPRKNQLAVVKQGSPAAPSEQPDRALVPDTANREREATTGTEPPKPRADKPAFVAASVRKPLRPSPRLAAKRQKLAPRLKEHADAPHEEVARAGAMRWEAEQPLTPRQREAAEQLMLALRLASAKLNYAQREMQEIGRAGK
ncbi:MAG TPA: hypothetical protein VGA87_00690 [Pyrinomonadaceae bacterium]